MTNALILLDDSKSLTLPRHLQTYKPPVDLPVIVDVNRMSIRGKRFRIILAGEEKQLKKQNKLGYMDCIIAAVHPTSSNRYFPKYDSESASPPICVSPDGVKPNKALSTEVQSKTCRGCIRKEEDPDTGYKQCAFFYRIVVFPVQDMSAFKEPLRFDIPSQSFFHDKQEVKIENDEGETVYYPAMGLKSLISLFSRKGVPIQAVICRIFMDDNADTPTVMFSLTNQFISEDHVALLKSQEAQIKVLVGFNERGQNDYNDDNDDDDDDDDDDDLPKTSNKKAEQQEEEEDPAPRRRRSGKVNKVADEDSDDDDTVSNEKKSKAGNASKTTTRKNHAKNDDDDDLFGSGDDDEEAEPPSNSNKGPSKQAKQSRNSDEGNGNQDDDDFLTGFIVDD